MVEGFTFGFPSYAEHVLLFSHNWLGRQFGLPSSDAGDSTPRVILFEPGVGKAFDIAADLLAFHNDVLVNQADAALATSFFADWKKAHPETIPIGPNDCAGYRIPLFLGGRTRSRISRSSIAVCASTSRDNSSGGPVIGGSRGHRTYLA